MVKESLISPMESMQDKLNTALLIFDKKLGFESINKAAERILGLDLKLLKKEFENQKHPSLKSFLKIIYNLENGQYDEELFQLENSIRHFRLEVKIDAQYFNCYISVLEKDKFVIELSQIVYQDMNQSTHELKRPIQNIKTLVETLMLGAKNDSGKLDEYLAKLNFEADRLGTMVTDMLSLSHVINGSVELHKTNCKLQTVGKKLLELAEGRAKSKKIHLVNEIDASFEFEADLKLLEHLLSNFIDNAIKYNKNDGTVYLKNTANSFIVEDTGLGISEEDKVKVFEQFYRIKDRAHISGTGLGLSIVKAIADLHGWTIEIESELGKGTQFIIKFH